MAKEMKELYLGGSYDTTLIEQYGIPYELQSPVFGTLRLMRVSEKMYATKEVHLNGVVACGWCHVVLFLDGNTKTVELANGLEAMEYQFSPICRMDLQTIGDVCFSCIITSAMKEGNIPPLIGRTIIPGERSEAELLSHLEIGGNIEANLKEAGIEVGELKVVNPCEFVYFSHGIDLKIWRVGKIGTHGCGIEKIDCKDGWYQIGVKLYRFEAVDGYYRLVEWKGDIS